MAVDDINDKRDNSTTTGAGSAPEAYPAHIKSVLMAPDRFFDSAHRSDGGHAVIDVAIYAAAVFLASLIARVTGYSGMNFEFGYVIDAVKAVLVIGIPFAAAIFALNFYGNRDGTSLSAGFYLEKIAGGLLLPALLLLAAALLDLLDIRIHSWLRGLSMALLYVLIFGCAYRYTGARRIGFAVVFLAAFYLLYRLLTLLF